MGIPLSAEHKEKMRLGREKARAEGRRLGGRRPLGLSVPVERQPAAEEPERIPAPAEDEFAPYELTADERAEIEAEVARRWAADTKSRAKKAFAKDLLDRLQRAAGEEPPDVEAKRRNEEMVWVLIQLPRLRKPSGGRHEPEPIILDGMVYRHGQHREVPRAVAVTLLDIMDKAGRHVRQVDGDSMVDFNPGSFRLTYQGGSPAGGGMLGPSFDSLHKRPA